MNTMLWYYWPMMRAEIQQHHTLPKSLNEWQTNFANRQTCEKHAIEKNCLCHNHDSPSSNGLHVRKLQGKHMTSDTWNLVRRFGRDLCARTNEVSEEKNVRNLSTNNKTIKNTAEPCHHHQCDVYLEGLIKEMANLMRWLLEENSSQMHSSLIIHLDAASFVVKTDKESCCEENYPKGK